MLSFGDKFPGEERWDDFKATRPKKLRETSPLATFLIDAFLTVIAGLAGSVATVLVAWRYSYRYRFWIPGRHTVDTTTWILVAAAAGFAIGAGWALRSILAGRRRSRERDGEHERHGRTDRRE